MTRLFGSRARRLTLLLGVFFVPLVRVSVVRGEPPRAANAKHVESIARCVAKAEQRPEKFSQRLADCFAGLPLLVLLDAPLFSDSKRAALTTHVHRLAESELLRRVATSKPFEQDVVIRRWLAARPLPMPTLLTLAEFASGQRALYERMSRGSAADAADQGAIASQLSRALAAPDRDRVLGVGADAKIRATTWDAYLADRARKEKVALGVAGNRAEYADAVLDLVQAAIDRKDPLEEDDLWVLSVNPAMGQGKPLERLTAWASASDGYADRFQTVLFTMLHQVTPPSPRAWGALMASPQLALAANVAATGTARAKTSALFYLADHVERPAAKPFEELVVGALRSPDAEVSQAAVRIAMASFPGGGDDIARPLARWLIDVSEQDDARDVPPLWVELGIWLEAQSRAEYGFRKARHDLVACGYDERVRLVLDWNRELVRGKSLAKHVAQQKPADGTGDRERAAAAAAENEARQARWAAFRSARSALATRFK